jgi:hypothetical protein
VVQHLLSDIPHDLAAKLLRLDAKWRERIHAIREGLPPTAVSTRNRWVQTLLTQRLWTGDWAF